MQPGILFIALIAALQIQHGARLTHAAVSGYLDFDNLPETNFSCEGKVIGGYYADVETACQMFHVCTIGQKGEVTDIKFLCLNGTVFDQETRVCERIDEVDCSQAEEFYGLNLELYGANAFIAGRNVPEDLEDAANSGEVETSTPPNTTPPSTTTTTTVATTTTTKAPATTPLPPPPQLPSPKPSPPKFIPPTPRPHPHHQQQFGTTSPGTLSLLAFAHNQNHEGLRNVVPHQHQQIYHNSQRPPLQPSQPTRAPLFPTTRRPPHSFSLKPLITSSRPPLPQQQQVHSGHFTVTTRPTQILQNQPHRHQQPPNPTLQSFKQFQQEQKAQQDLQRQKEQQQQRQQQIQQQQQQQRQPPEQFSTQHHYFGNGYHHNHNFQHHSQLPESSPSSLLSVSPSPSPSHLLSPPPPPTSPSPSQAPFHHNQQFHPLLLNGLSLDQGQGQPPSASPSPSPNSPHQSPFFGGHHFSTPVPSLREGKDLEQDDEETAAHEQHQQQIQQQQIQQQQQQHEQHQQRIQQHQQNVQQQQQKQQAQQQQQIQRQQQQQEHHIHQHFPPPPTVAVVSSSSSTSTSHSSVAIVTGGFNNLGTSSTTTPTPPPVTSTSISISGPSGGGHPVIELRHPHDPSAPSAEDGGEHFDDEYSDSDYALDSFFEDVPKLRSVGGSDERSRRRKRSESDDAGVVGGVPSSLSAQDGFEAKRRGGRGRLRQTSITLQVSPQAVSFAEETPARRSDIARSDPSRTQTSPVEEISSVGQRTRSRQRSNFGQLRASFRAQPIPVAEESPRPRGRQGEARRLTHPRSRPSYEEVESDHQGENISIPLDTTTTSVPPTTTQLPETSFSCVGKVPGGLYADPEVDCKLFHICSQGRHGRLIDNKFLCGPETRFNQQSRTCQTKELVDCASAPSYYFLNVHFQPPVIEVRPELKFEAQKVHVKRSVPSLRAVNLDQVKQKHQKRVTSFPASIQGNSNILQHCFDEKHCGNKWKINSNSDFYRGMRRKRDSSNPIFDRRRPRFGLSARATTEKPKDIKPTIARPPNRSFTSPKFGSTRREDSRTPTVGQDKIKSAPRSFVPSQSKYRSTGRVEHTTESARRKSVTSGTTSRPKFGRSRSSAVSTTRKPKFGRGRIIATTTSTTSRPQFGRGRSFSSLTTTTTTRPVFSHSRGTSSSQSATIRPKFDRSKIFKSTSENRGVAGNAKERDSKLPVTFRQHNILNQVKTTIPAAEDEVEEKTAVTEALQTENKKMGEITNGDEKEIDTKGNSRYSEEEYVDEDEEGSDENYVEEDEITSDKDDSKAISSGDKNKAVALKISEDSSGEKGLKILNIFPVTSQGTVFKAEIGGKEYRFNGKDWVKVEDDTTNDTEEDDEAYSEEYIDDEDDGVNNENSQDKENVEDGEGHSSNQRNPKSFSFKESDSQKNNDVEGNSYNIKSTGDDVYEDDSYEDDWDSEEIENSDLNNEKVTENDNNKLPNNPYSSGRRVTNNDMTELSPTGTTLNVKPDNEFGLSETDEDDFEETNRAVRKTSLGRRKIQSLGSDGKVRGESRKSIKPELQGAQGENQVKQRNGIRKSHAEDDDYEDSKGTDEEEVYEEEEGHNSKRGNENIHASASWKRKENNFSPQEGSKSPNDGSMTAYEDDEYVDEYEETPITGKPGFLRSVNVNQDDTLNRGSLLHLPIPSLKNIHSGSQKSDQQGQSFGNSWDSDEENYTLEQDDEYPNEGGEVFQDEDEQYDDQEEGHDHGTGVKGIEEEFYPDEEEVVATRGVVKHKKILAQGAKPLQSDDPEYLDNEEDNNTGKGSKGAELRYDEYEANDEEDDNVTEGKHDSRVNERKWSNQGRGKDSKQAPLPYLRLVNPEILEEDYTTTVPSTPNLFRTVKPRQQSWKQASAPDLPPVILPRRTTVAPVEVTTPQPRGYRKGKSRNFQGGFSRQGNAREESEQPVTQAPRRWQPKQQVTQSDETPITKGFTPSRGTYRNTARGDENQGRAAKSFPKTSRFPSPKPATPTRSTVAVSPTRAAGGYRVNKPQLRTYARKRISDVVQFSESQLSKSRQNFPIPYPNNEKDIENSFTSDAGQNKFDNSKNRGYNKYQSDDRADLISQPTLAPIADENSTPSPPTSVSESTYFPLPMPTSTPTTPGAFFCNDLEMFVFHADPSNPRLFHYCSPGFSRGQILDFRFSCIKGMSFSEEYQRCV